MNNLVSFGIGLILGSLIGPSCVLFIGLIVTGYYYKDDLIDFQTSASEFIRNIMSELPPPKKSQ